MVKLTTMLSVWLWGGIFVFLFLYFSHRKEIKEAELESIHLCVIFTLCCFVGLPAAVIEILDYGKMMKKRMKVLIERQMKSIVEKE